MNVALFANGAFGTRVVSYLQENFPNDLSLLVHLDDPAVLAAAASTSTKEMQFVDESEVIATLQDASIDLGLFAWWPGIMSERLISTPRHGFLNMHPSLLPFGRGKHYNFWAIVEESPFGVTLHFADKGVDSGRIVAQREIAYDWSDTGGSLYAKAQDELFLLFAETYPSMREKVPNGTSQDLSRGSYHHSNELQSASTIDLERTYTGRELLNLLRARTFDGHPGCRFEESGMTWEVTIKVREVRE